MSKAHQNVKVEMAPDGHHPFPEFDLPETTAIQRAQAPGPIAYPATTMGLIQQAVAMGAGVETLRELFALKKEVEADEARKAFNEAFSAFKMEAVHVVKNVTYKDGPLKGKRHADLFAVVDAVTPALSKHGLSMSWKLSKDEKDWLEVTCTVRHAMGHSESVSMGSGPDTGPARNAIQARASAKTYLERYTALSILGLAAEDMDDDGAATAEWPELKERLKLIAEAPDFPALESSYKSAFKKAKEDRNEDAMKSLISAKDRRKADLAQENPA